MNTRGLMELVLLNVLRERGLITPALFTIMVLMAVVTTMMTTPLLSWINTPRADLAGSPHLDATSITRQ